MKSAFTILFLTVVLVMAGCSAPSNEIRMTGNETIVKKVSDSKVTAIWFYYSELTHAGPDYVVLEKDGEIIEIFKSHWNVTDINLRGDSLLVRYVNERMHDAKLTTRKKIFDYHVVWDSCGETHERFQ